MRQAVNRGVVLCSITSVLVALSASGCMSPWFKRNEPDITQRRQEIKEKLLDDERPTVVKDIASPALLTQSRIENIGLITQLRQTGGIVNASAQREKMLDIMRRRDANQPNTFLDDDTTALGVVTAFVPPAARQGQPLDVMLKLSSHAEASDLQHGWLMETSLVEMSFLGGEVREGFDLAKAEGYVVTKHQVTGEDAPEAKLEGLIVGGGRLLKERNLGIAVDADFADAITMSAIVPAINRRFTYFNGQKQDGIATPRESSFVEIKVPPKYELDPFHFINVVLRVGFNETASQRNTRIETLQKQLTEATTVREACWQLEALGEESIPMLTNVLDHPNPEIRFYAAHSLAYLNERAAIPKLRSLCLAEPAFRAMCLNGLTIMDHYEAADALEELLHAANAEVRFGAMRALRQKDPSLQTVAPQKIMDAGYLLTIPSSGPPLVAASLNQTPEIVVFGENPQLHIPAFLYVNPHIIVSPQSVEQGGGLKVSHFQAGKDDQITACSANLLDTLHAIAEVGGTYGDWINFVRQCHAEGLMIEPFAMNPMPVAGRKYERDQAALDAEAISAPQPESLVLPVPETTQSAYPIKDTSKSNVWNPFTWGK